MAAFIADNSATTGYAPGNPEPGPAGSGPEEGGGYWSIEKLKRGYSDYLWGKRDEIEEQKDARKYYHGSQWTSEQIEKLKQRKQPAMTFNRTARKIDGVVGLLERLRQDPKAFPRTPQHEHGADLATAVLRYVLDAQDWAAKSPEVARDGAIDGIGGLEINLTQGDQGDRDIEFDIVEPDTFFYDPRSYRMDFSDVRYMGVSKWVDLDLAKEMFPDKAEELEASVESDTDLMTDSDREMRWTFTTATSRRVRLVDNWYQHQGGWCFCVHTGSVKLIEGKSYLTDEKRKGICKFIMFSANVDHDGDRYGFVRNLKSAQDGINAKQSKMQHLLASNRLKMTRGAVADVEKARREWARPDGIIEINPGTEIEEADKSFDFAGWSKLLELNLAEIENFGPNPALIGQGVENKSGRAIALLQQAGIAELGPYILAYKGWKLRVYRAIWNAIQQHWQAERWIRVTDDQEVAQFIQINGLGVDPQTGMPAIVNALGSLDVDIIIDEGPDTVNMMADTYDALSMLAAKGAAIPPDVLIEAAPLNYATKKRMLDKMEKASQQPPPELAAKQAELQMKQQEMQATAQFKVQDQQAQLQLKAAEAQQSAALEQQKADQQIELKRAELVANIQLKREEAAADIELERIKAENQMALACHKHQCDADMKAQEMAGREREGGQDEESMQRTAVRDHTEELAALMRMVEKTMRIAAAPRRSNIIRDPKTNRPVAAVSVIETNED